MSRVLLRTVCVVTIGLLACGAPPAATQNGHYPLPPGETAARPTAAPTAPPRGAAAPTPGAARPVLISLTRGSDANVCGLDAAGQIWCWIGMELARAEPHLPQARVLSQGTRHGCALDAAGVASCWGSNDRGQLGSGKTSAYRDAPGPVLGLPPVAEISAHYDRTCARTAAGDVYCWGDRSWGKGGDGTLIEDGLDTAMKLAIGAPIVRRAVAIASGMSHTCVAFQDGTVSCWGTNLSGRSGSSHIHPPLARPTVVPHATGVVALSAGELSTCSIDRVGAVRCWGSTLGAQTPSPAARYPDARPAPRTIALPGPAVELAVGTAHACARTIDGRVFCWGEGDRGQLGDGTSVRRETAGQVPLVGPAAQLSGSMAGTCALVAGHVYCWGQDHGPEARTDAARPTEPAPPAR